ncbi:U3 small nucleolar RNA-associated protein MPP10 [Smittium culicis]|uniref:U3 small nucleolar ribonucleoprotein protein MPP10 n=1 Tax=Smittium culicis TaxID=133412 RepID=A0A1R1XI40_9FUNG|nr:U3 small nucleolar RNA-associated protein MPP10 [Smittium culicis]
MENFMLNFPLQPEDYFSPDKKIKEKCFNLSKAAFDLGNKNVCYGTLKELLGENDGFTQAEQIWELIQLRNKSVLSHAKKLLDDIPENYNSILSDSFSQDSDSGEDSLYSDDYPEGSESETEALTLSDNENFIDSENTHQNLEEDSDLNSESEIDQDNELDLPDSEQDSDMENDSDLDNSVSDSKTLSDNDLSDLEDLDQHGELEKEKKKSNKKSVVDDDFFSLDQMHKFVEEAEQSEMRDRMILAGEGDPFESKNDKLNSDESSSEDEDDDLNYFEDMDELDEEDGDESDMDPSKIKYDDFFKPVTTSKRAIAKESRESHAKRSKFDPKTYKNSEKNATPIDESDDESDNEADEGGEYGLNEEDNDLDIQESEDDLNDSTNKSTFEIYQQKLNSQISQLEKDAVTKKDWVMTGEVTSRLRPIDSLLGEHLDYDYVQKPVPIITQQVTESLEELIKRRILASEYNDVVRKKQDLDQDYFRSSRADLDDAAPKKSLAEVYEQEYLEQRENSSSHLPGGKKSIYTDTELELHKEISSMMKSLTYTLDSLTNFYYTPKVKTANAEIRVDAPAIEMEEALPVKVSSVSQLAPEEIYSNISGKSSKVSKTGKKSLIDSQTTHTGDDNEEDEEESSFANQTDIVSFGLGTGEIKGASEATEADRRRWRAMKKKAFKKSNSGKPQKPTDPKSK